MKTAIVLILLAGTAAQAQIRDITEGVDVVNEGARHDFGVLFGVAVGSSPSRKATSMAAVQWSLRLVHVPQFEIEYVAEFSPFIEIATRGQGSSVAWNALPGGARAAIHRYFYLESLGGICRAKLGADAPPGASFNNRMLEAGAGFQVRKRGTTVRVGYRFMRGWNDGSKDLNIQAHMITAGFSFRLRR